MEFGRFPAAVEVCMRRGFALIEVMVVIVLIVLLLPVVASVCEAARRLEGANTLEPTGLAQLADNFRNHAEDSSQKGVEMKKPAALPERLKVVGIENVYRLSPRLYSGGQPEGRAGFSALKRLGIRTLISVDGA